MQVASHESASGGALPPDGDAAWRLEGTLLGAALQGCDVLLLDDQDGSVRGCFAVALVDARVRVLVWKGRVGSAFCAVAIGEDRDIAFGSFGRAGSPVQIFSDWLRRLV
eukprot:1174749-Pleurochrysis_carterae.AAC.1